MVGGKKTPFTLKKEGTLNTIPLILTLRGITNLINKIDIDELEKLAGEATPGPWFFDMGNHEVESHSEEYHRVPVAWPADLSEIVDHCKRYKIPTCRANPMGNLSFIAAANPETIKALCKVVRALMCYGDSRNWDMKDWEHDICSTCFSLAYNNNKDGYELAKEALKPFTKD